MMRFKFLMCAVLAGIASAGLAPSARAGFALEYSVNGGAFVMAPVTGTGAPLNPYSALVLIGNLSVTATGGGSTSLSASSINLSIGGSEAANTSIQVYVSMSGVLTGPPPETLTSSMGNGVDPTATVTESDYLAASNTLFDLTTPVVGPSVIAAGTAQDNTVGANLAPQYSWTLGTLINNTSGNPTGQLSILNNASLATTPVPAGLVLLASAVPVLVGGTWFRRRKVQQTR